MFFFVGRKGREEKVKDFFVSEEKENKELKIEGRCHNSDHFWLMLLTTVFYLILFYFVPFSIGLKGEKEEKRYMLYAMKVCAAMVTPIFT